MKKGIWGFLVLLGSTVFNISDVNANDSFDVVSNTFGECAIQDNVRGGLLYQNIPASTCLLRAKAFLTSAPPRATVTAGNFYPNETEGLKVQLTAARGPVQVGLCLSQDSLRGGKIHGDLSAESCFQKCLEFRNSASSRARVHNCSWVRNNYYVTLLPGRPALN